MDKLKALESSEELLWQFKAVEYHSFCAEAVISSSGKLACVLKLESPQDEVLQRKKDASVKHEGDPSLMGKCLEQTDDIWFEDLFAFLNHIWGHSCDF